MDGKKNCLWTQSLPSGVVLSTVDGQVNEDDKVRGLFFNKCELELTNVTLNQSGQWECEVLLDKAPGRSDEVKQVAGAKIQISVLGMS